MSLPHVPVLLIAAVKVGAIAAVAATLANLATGSKPRGGRALTASAATVFILTVLLWLALKALRTAF